MAEQDGRIVAMACTRPGRNELGQADPRLCHLQMIFVLPEHSGVGIGGRLLDFVLDEARTSDFDSIQLWVIEGNAPATRLYTRRGFRHTGRIVEEGGALIGLWSRPLDD